MKISNDSTKLLFYVTAALRFNPTKQHPGHIPSGPLANADISFQALRNNAAAEEDRNFDPPMNQTLTIDDIARSIDGEITPRKFRGVMDMFYGVSNTKYSRAVLAAFVRNYGCHCFQEQEKIVGGKGKPVDEQDSLCRRLQQCHTCVSMDHTNKCDPDVGNYRYTIDGTLKTISCSENTDKCKRNACECDKAFALDFAAIWDDNKFNRYYWKNKYNLKAGNPTFDMEETCKITGFGSPKDECCGEYPSRKPYNSVLYQCCEDGSVKSVGSCPP